MPKITPRIMIEDMQIYRRDNPKDTKAHIAEHFDTSISMVTEYTDHILRGETLSIEELRARIRVRQYTKTCDCGAMIRKRSTSCLACSKKKKPRYRLGKKVNGVYTYPPYELDKCEKAPTANPYHYYLVDRFNMGYCKICGQKEQFPVDGVEMTRIDVLTSSFDTFVPSWAE